MKRLLKVDVFVLVGVWCCLLPFVDLLSLALGRPLRVMATTLCTLVLPLFGSSAWSEGTTIHAGPAELAITDACSGVEGLFGLLLVGYLMARLRQRNLGWTLFDWAFAVPSVILANAVRLVVVVLLYEGSVGDAVLTGAWHEGLGFFQVSLSLAAMYGFGFLVRKLS